MLQIYAEVVALVVFWLAMMGFVLPYLFSSNSDFNVVAGVVLLVFFIPVTGWLIIRIVKKVKKQYEVIAGKMSNNSKKEGGVP